LIFTLWSRLVYHPACGKKNYEQGNKQKKLNMKKIMKGNYIRIEGKANYAQANFNDDRTIYVDYGSLPFDINKTGTTEKLGHLLKNPGKEYPATKEELSRFLRRLVKSLDE